MANKINVKLILELRDKGFTQNKIVTTRNMGKHSVSDVFHIADQKGITYDDVRDLSEEALYRLFFPDKHAFEALFEQPDYENVHKELKRAGVTLKVLWEEYRDACSAAGKLAMGYTSFCKGYSTYTIDEKVVSHIEHKPGIKIEVDWAGDTINYVDISTGEVRKAHLFVGVLPYSQYSYVEATRNEKMDTFIRCHNNMYAYFGGVTRQLVCDNLKTGVVSHPKEGEIILTADYEAMGEHYMTAIMPAGVRQPRQKASAESTVHAVTTAIIARLRNEVFYSFEDARDAVQAKLEEFNHEPFEKREGSRYEIYLDEKELLHPLPSMPYELSTWVYGRKVALDSHITFEGNKYSCPYQYLHQKVDLRVTDNIVEIYSGSTRIATHSRFMNGRKNQYSTHPEDMPDRLLHLEWDDVRIQKWADSIGEYTSLTVKRIFESAKIKEQGYNPALAVLRLSQKYSQARLEAACEFAIEHGIQKPRYGHLNSILSADQDIVYSEQKDVVKGNDASMGYRRGSEYYGGGSDDQ